MTSAPHTPFLVRLPDTLLFRAKTLVVQRGLKGGVARLICESLEAILDDMEKVPRKFDAAWLSQKGEPATAAQRCACYGGKYKAQKKVGDPIYLPRDWFTLSELFDHYASNTWDSRTALLIYRQQEEWLRQGQELVRMPIAPPGWERYPPQATGPEWAFRDRPRPQPGTPRDLNDLEDDEADDIT